MKQLTISGPCRETSETAITLNPESIFTRREKNQSLFHFSTLTSPELLITNLDVKQEKRIDDYWNIDGSRDLSDPWTGFTQFTLLEEKDPNGYVVRGEINKKTAYIQARSVARALEINGKGRQAAGEAKVD